MRHRVTSRSTAWLFFAVTLVIPMITYALGLAVDSPGSAIFAVGFVLQTLVAAAMVAWTTYVAWLGPPSDSDRSTLTLGLIATAAILLVIGWGSMAGVAVTEMQTGTPAGQISLAVFLIPLGHILAFAAAVTATLDERDRLE